MIVGVLQLEISIPGAESLKDKRRVVRSIKDRLHREHLVSVAEVARLETPPNGVLAIACVGREPIVIARTMDHCIEKIRRRTDCELVSSTRRIGAWEALLEPLGEEPGIDGLAGEMLARAAEMDLDDTSPESDS